MSYQYYIQNMNQLMGMYNTPIHYSMVPLAPACLPTQEIQPISKLWVVGCESNENNEADKRTLFCANLNGKTTEELLYEVFLQAGPIQKVHIPKDNTGKNRSYGFVTYKYHCSAAYAMRLYQGLVLFGLRLDIKLQGNN